MEGPSILLAAHQLKPFTNKVILEVSGNTKIGKERLLNQKVLKIFSWGKHLVFQFSTFAMRVHFMLYGSFQATVKGRKVTGDYPTKNRPTRLALTFANGHIEMYNCSLRFLEETTAEGLYDYSIDTISPFWDSKKALRALKNHPDEQIGDLLLEQSLFAGVGNIIKNEVLFIVKVSPETLAKELSTAKLKEIIKTTEKFVQDFYKWRKRFELKKHYQIYRKGVCVKCNGKVRRIRTGKKQRISYICENCQS